MGRRARTAQPLGDDRASTLNGSPTEAQPPVGRRGGLAQQGEMGERKPHRFHTARVAEPARPHRPATSPSPSPQTLPMSLN